jgi:8-oxo-dGTP pyrophosphatase MutT (NUDIX family)
VEVIKVRPAKQDPTVRYAVGLIVVRKDRGEVLLLRRRLDGKKPDGADETWRGLYQVGVHGGVEDADWDNARNRQQSVRKVALLRESREEVGHAFTGVVLGKKRHRGLQVVNHVHRTDKDITTYRVEVSGADASLVVVGPEHDHEPLWISYSEARSILTPEEVNGNKSTPYDGSTIFMFPDEREVVWKEFGVNAEESQAARSNDIALWKMAHLTTPPAPAMKMNMGLEDPGQVTLG